MKTSLTCLVLSSAVLLVGCETPTIAMQHSPEFAPVYPTAVEKPRLATGGIYNGRQSDGWFGRGRSYQVGDIVTVLLNESTQAARNQSTEVSRESKNDMLKEGVLGEVKRLSSIMNGINLSGANIESAGQGAAAQRATLTGSVAATIVEILANGNLVVRGEKQLALTEGAEVIQVSGIIRPEDVSPNNTVQSRRLANAQIAYRGSGDLANASRPGWGIRGLMKIWPF
jgi:flagellar L-ring protein precursor FlgH